MGLILTSKLQALRHGAYIIERTPPAVIAPTGTGICAMVAQLPWGPDQTLTTPTSVGDRLRMFAPPGSDHTVSGYMCMTQKAFPILKIVRVTGDDSAAATATVNKTGPTGLLTLTAKYVGELGSSLTWAVSAATDGDTNHFNLKVSLTGDSGTTEELLQNLNYSGVGADSTPSFTSLVLLGGITKLSSGVPIADSSGTFSGGSDGTVTSAEYVGTEGTGDKGMALLEGDQSIRHFFTDDPGDSLRAAVNSGGRAHADFKSNRIFYTQGDSGMTVDDTNIDADLYRSIEVVYCDPWCYVFDDVDGTKRLVPPAPFAASMAANLSPSTSIAWKSSEATKFLDAIVELESDRGDAAALNTDNGIVTLVKEDLGGFSFEAGVVTEAPIEPSKKYDVRTRMLHFIGTSLVNSVRPFTDGPNTTDNQQNIVDAVEAFLDTLKRNKDRDSNHLPHILDYQVEDLTTANDDTSLGEGEFSVPISIRISAPMSKIFFLLNIGTQVTITQQAA